MSRDEWKAFRGKSCSIRIHLKKGGILTFPFSKGELRPPAHRAYGLVRGFFGANATIICGNTIGRYAVIGAGAVVTKEVPDYTLMLGNPARTAGWMCECGHQFKFHGDIGTCPEAEKALLDVYDSL